MTIKKSIFALTFILGAATVSFADTKNAKENKEGKEGTEIAAPSQTESKAKASFFWYSQDGSQSLGEGENPNNGCTQEGTGCAKGYSEEQTLPATQTPDATRRSN